MIKYFSKSVILHEKNEIKCRSTAWSIFAPSLPPEKLRYHHSIIIVFLKILNLSDLNLYSGLQLYGLAEIQPSSNTFERL